MKSDEMCCSSVYDVTLIVFRYFFFTIFVLFANIIERLSGREKVYFITTVEE